MKKILVISPAEDVANDLQQSLYKFPALFLSEPNLGRARLFLSAEGNADFIFLDSASLGYSPLEEIQEISILAKGVPLFLMVDKLARGLEPEALMAGAQHVLEMPLRGDLVSELLSRNIGSHKASLIAPNQADIRESLTKDNDLRLLQVARNFIEVPRFAKSKEAACSKTISLLREMTGYRKVVVYFTKSAVDQKPPKWALELSYGVGKETLDQVALSSMEGIGSHLVQHGQIIQHDSLDVQRDGKISSTFKLLNVDAAIPIIADNLLMGVVMVGNRITGEVLDRQELLLLYFLLENLGLYLKNPPETNIERPNYSNLPELEKHPEANDKRESQPSSHNQEWSATEKLVLTSCEDMPSGYILLDQGGNILMANKKARALFGVQITGSPHSTLKALPAVMQEQLQSLFSGRVERQPTLFRHPVDEQILLRSKTFYLSESQGVGKTAGVIVEEIHEIGEGKESITIDPAPKVPLPQEVSEQDNEGGIDHSTGTEEIDSRCSRIYDKLARQIHYSLVPLSTHSQLLQQGHFDDDFQETLAEVIDSGVEKFTRFSRQLSYMARKKYDLSDKVQWKKIIETAFEEAADFYGDPSSKFELIEESDPALIQMEEVALRFAISEIFLNALQANKSNPQFLVKVRRHASQQEPKRLELIIRDMGDGFEESALKNAFEPFFSTRPAGLGLGLTIAKNIIEGHQGSVYIRRTPAENQHEIVVFLPVYR